MNAKISGLVICVEAIVYLLLDILHNCTFKARFSQIVEFHSTKMLPLLKYCKKLTH